MRNIFIIFIGLLFTINLSAHTNRRVIQLTGTISNKYPIVMTLTIENENVLGFYYYKKYKTKILLEGQMIGDKFTLTESSSYKPKPEFKKGFILEMTKSNFIGNWIDKYNDKKLNCKLIIKSDKQTKLTDDIVRIEGTYENLYNTENHLGSVDLKNITGDIFYFEISTATKSGCVGYINGIVELKDLKNGVFSTEYCEKLEFQLSNDVLSVDERDCEWHGLRCYFIGEYKKEELKDSPQ